MADPALAAFVKEALAAGKSRDEIARTLGEAGWPEDQVRGALAAYADVDFPVPVPRPQPYGLAREAFFYIVYFALLGLVVGDIYSLCFAWIDSAFADPLDRAWDWRDHPVRWAMASLIVGYPIFLYLGWRLAMRRRRDPERRSSRLRAWLTYITLIFAAVVLIGDLVAVVYQFLTGELGIRFLMKAGVVGVIAAGVLFNYVRDVERSGAGADWLGRGFAAVTTGIVVALVAWGFHTVSGPERARARIADEQRIADIGAIANLVDCHLTYVGSVPESLPAMTEALSGRMQRPMRSVCGAETPKDPATGESYGYRRTGEARYEICAIFDHGWPESTEAGASRRRAVGEVRLRPGPEARHIELPLAGGEACFEFEARTFPVEDEGPSRP